MGGGIVRHGGSFRHPGILHVLRPDYVVLGDSIFVGATEASVFIR